MNWLRAAAIRARTCCATWFRPSILGFGILLIAAPSAGQINACPMDVVLRECTAQDVTDGNCSTTVLSCPSGSTNCTLKSSELNWDELDQSLSNVAAVCSSRAAALFLATPAASSGRPQWRAIVAGDLPAATTSSQGAVVLAMSGEATAGEAVQGNDSRLSDARTPTGAAGGALGGTYPNPTVDDDGHAHTSSTISAIDVGDDTNLAAGAGVALTGDSLATASQESGFLADGGTTDLVCGGGAAGQAQVLDGGELNYCDGAATAVARKGFLDADGTDDDAPEAGDFGALALAGDVSSSGLTTTIGADKVTAGMVAFNYAGSASEGGPATTALALDANGANCSAGNYPLGVNASGAAESCTADDDAPDSDGEVPDVITVAGGDAGSGTTSTRAKIEILSHNTDCTSITDGSRGELCYEEDSDRIFSCEPTSGGCDTAAEWRLASGAAGSVPNREFYWTASALLPLEHGADSVPPVALVQGTNVDILVRDFDASTDECVSGTLLVPAGLNTGGTVTFRAKWYPASAAANNVMWDIRHVDRDHGESWDAALTTVAAAASAASASANVITETTWTETVSNLGWDASDVVLFELCRDANHASDTLAGDARLIDFAIEVPRS